MHHSLRRLLLLALAVGLATAAAPAEERVYLGAARCRECHQAAGNRDQFTPWYLSKHARAYAALAMPESREIARLSGVDVEPSENPVCLGCHTTAFDVEGWEKDETFFAEDGVQCEACHGPGSDYAEAAIMADSEAAGKAGLRTPGEEACLICHQVKGTHLAVLKVDKWEFPSALAQIAHPGRGGPLPEIPAVAGDPEQGPRYVGAMACARCHSGTEKGHVLGKWRLSAHAEAFAHLGTEDALRIARTAGLTAHPQESAACRRCHTTGAGEPPGRFEASFDPARGVQCESCHGPGSEHGALAAEAAVGSELRPVGRETCEACHTREAHGESFDYTAARQVIDHSVAETSTEVEARYKTPVNLALTADGRRLFVTAEAADSLIVVDTESRSVVAEIEVQNQPNGVCLSLDGTRVFVSNRGSDTVSEIDVGRLEVTRTISVGDEPHGLVTDPAGRTLYVANAGSFDISVVDLTTGKETKRLAAAPGTWDVSLSADGRSVFVTNNLSLPVEFRTPSRSEVTVIDTERRIVRDRIVLPEANLVQGVDASPDGELALVTLIRTKNLVPITRVIQGWVITNGLGVLWKDGRVDQLLLDEVDDHFADPTDVVFTPDGRHAFVSGGGIDAVAVVDLERLKAVLRRASPEERESVLPNHLGVPTEYVLARIGVGRSPRGLVASRDGRVVYVADGLDDTVSVIDVARRERSGVIDLGGSKEISLERFGERVFHSASVTFGRQFSCHSCHPDGGVDRITYDIEPDGIGLNPVDNRSLRGILDTAPFKWTGKNPSLNRQCGPRLAVFFTRIDPFTPEQVEALARYICTIPRNPNRYRLTEELTPAQRRGQALYERTDTNSGQKIPEGQVCSSCHSGPYYTNRRRVDVGTRSELDTQGAFDVPHLNNIYESPPYLHDGRAHTLEEIWTRFNPHDQHGVTNDMTKDQLNELIEYLKTL